MKKKLIIIAAFICMIIFYSCSASTGGRYSNDEGKNEKNEPTKKSNSEVKEDFDFTPYRTKLDIPEKKLNFPAASKNPDVWYGYEEKNLDTLASSKKIISKVSGYRVLVIATDNLQEADSMRSDIYFKTAQKQVYISFDPPFYKVSVGDFKDYSNANNLSFKLKQMGYSEARVVSDSVNVFEQ
jgi:SPOR domain